MLRWPIGAICLLLGGLVSGADLASAEANRKRVEALVQAGAAPRTALQAAERTVQDARDELFLRDTLYAGNVTPDQVPEMLRAASNLKDHAMEALATNQKLVAEGVIPAKGLERWEQELTRAQRQWELAQSRAKLVEELTEMARREAELAESAPRFEGKGALTDQDFFYVETAFYEQFTRLLPVSARGATAVHRSLGFDHRQRYDVALNPDQEEGRWLIHLLDQLRVPYIAFRRAVAGRATGAHIHVGLPSPPFTEPRP